MFALIIIILISIYAIVFNGVFPLIITLFSSVTTLLVPYSSDSSYDGPLIALGIKSDAYSLDGYNSNTYNLLT